MKRIALITALATTIPVAAYAWPTGRVADPQPSQTYWRDRDHDRYDRDDRAWTREHYDRYGNSHFANDFRGRWVPIARGYSAHTDRQMINVGNGRFRKIRIEAVRGQPLVTKIAIEFADQSTQAIEMDARLPAGSGEVIDLNGGVRRVHRIIVYTDPNSRGAYSIYGA
jgi:hypothetical protein